MLKFFITLTLFLVIHNSFAESQEGVQNSLIIEIKNGATDSIVILDKDYIKIETIYRESNNYFFSRCNFDKGYYYLNVRNENVAIYFDPSFDLHVTFDITNIDSTITFEGGGAYENDFIRTRQDCLQSFGEMYYGLGIFRLSENEFLRTNDSIFKVLKALLSRNKKNLNHYFVFLESMFLNFKKLTRIAQYENLHGFVIENDRFKVSDNFPDPFRNIDLENSNLLNVIGYVDYLEQFLHNQAGIIWEEKKELDYMLVYANLIRNIIGSGHIQNKLSINVGLYDLSRTDHLDSLFNVIKPLITNEEKLTDIQEIYKKLNRTKKGNLSPNFVLKDLDGKEVSLYDFRGSVVYIDLWASWCMPCVKEFRYLNELKEKFKKDKIVFINICVNDTEANWRKTVQDEEIAGVNLYAPDNKISFFQDYDLKSLPRYILLDKKSQIIDADAERPSHSEIVTLLKSYITE